MYTLMIKKHNVTGLQYLCKTNRKNTEKYTGSGVAWKKHLAKYGRDLSTTILLQTEDLSEFNKRCVEASELYNVVNSDKFANLIVETGLDGGVTHNNPYWLVGFKHSAEAKKKISDAAKDMWSRATRESHPGLYEGQKHTEETKEKMRKPKPPFSAEHRKNIGLAKLGKRCEFPPEKREQYSNRLSKRQTQKYKCSICLKTGNQGQIGRYHKQCMENTNWKKLPIP